MWDPLLEKLEQPWFRRLLLFVVALVIFVALDLRPTIFGRLLAPAIGNPLTSGWYGRLSIAAVLAAVLVLDVWLVTLLSFRWQVVVVWIELTILFFVFFESFNLSFPFILSKLSFLITQGAFTTLYISMVSILIASAIALIAALARLSNNGPAYAVASFYISFFRGVPLLMQVYLVYLGLPQLGFVVNAVPSGITALSLCYGAYMAEIFRAGIQGVPQGQREAAASLGLKPSLVMRKIVLPQAMKLIVPPIGNQFIAMLKDSSLVSVVGVWDLMFLARTLGRAQFRHMEMLITAAVIYWIMTIALERIQVRIERYYGKGDVGQRI